MHRDKYGIIVQADGDDGDSLHREGLMLFAGQRSTMWTFLYTDGRFHRGTTKWTDPSNVSRDQLIPLLAWATQPARDWNYEQVRRHFKGILMRAPNGDVGLTHISMFLRGQANYHIMRLGLVHRLSEILLFTLLHFTDLFFLAGAIIKIFPVRYNDQKKRLEWNDMDKVDDWNDVIPLLHAVRSYPTLTSWLARFIYRTFRKKNHGRNLTMSWNRIEQALRWYNRASSGGNPELVDLYKEDLDRFFSTPSLVRKARQLMGRFGCFLK